MILNSSRKDWVNIPLSILCTTIVGGGTPSTKISEYWKGSIPWISSADIDNSNRINPRRYVTYEAIENSATNLVPKDTLIVVTRVGLGKLALAPFELCFSQDNQGLIFHENVVLPKYALYFLKTVVNDLTVKGRGTTISGVTKKHLQELIFALPPLPEQRCIVAKIEELFSELDKGLDTLKTLQQQLKLYRQAVLKAACEGRLTEEWRKHQNDLPTSRELIDQFLDLQASKGKNNMAVSFNDGLVPGQYEGWISIPLGYLADRIVDGTHHTPTYVPCGIPFISVKDIRCDRVHFDNCKYISAEEHSVLIKRCYPEPEDILITKSGTIGRTALVPDCVFSLFVSVALIKIQGARRLISPQFLKRVIDNYMQSISISQNIKGGVIKNYHLEDLKLMTIHVCSLREQEIIVQEIESRLSVADKLEETIEQTLHQSEALRQSILKKAFEGRLLSESELEEVRQEPDWEPASVLLEKIKVHKLTADTSKQPAPKSTRKGKKQA